MKILKPLLFLLIAGLAIGGMYWKSIQDNPTPVAGEAITKSNVTLPFKEIQAKCNNMGKRPWNINEYRALKRLIETSSTGTSTITPDEASTLKSSLEQQYAESMVRSYEAWIKSFGTTNINEVYNVMITQAAVSGCKALLDRPIMVIKKHELALTIPSLVESFKHQKFDNGKHADLMNIINDCCVNTIELVSFFDIIDIYNSSTSALSAFKTYGSAFNKKLEWIAKYPGDKIIQLQKYCSDEERGIAYEYEWYDNYIQNNSICF
jgi:hypothetical protein